MAAIIAATDFTEVAENAIHYACRLATDHNAGLTILHTYAMPIMFSDVPIPSPIADEQKISEENMRKLVGKLRIIYPAITISSSIIYGDVQDGIEDFTKKNGEPLLVIIGNGYDQDHPAWMESTLMQALKELKYPILAIPATTSYEPVKQVCLAYDNKYAGSDIALVKLREMISFLGAQLHVLLAHTDATTKERVLEINKDAQQLLSKVQPSYHIIYGNDVEEAISDYAAQYQLDWVAVIPRRHSFFAGLFHKSHTRIIVNNIHVPILSLHENDV